jgi:hypothetical protein
MIIVYYFRKIYQLVTQRLILKILRVKMNNYNNNNNNNNNNYNNNINNGRRNNTVK